MDFDVIVIGAGPGGYVTAIRASQLGFRTAIVERAELGGICLNWGCIPTKALLKSSEVYHTLGHLDDYGLSAERPAIDLKAVVERSRKIAAQMNSGVAYLLRKHKVQVIRGEARLESGAPAPTVVVDAQKLTAKHVILATGAKARTLPSHGLEPDGERVWTYREALVPTSAPKSLLVVGSGA
ncbi:MAG TPA: FAD-dependent oxidoreductase, partial [Caulobacteraceae bacterium]|nr:FAD-dependent oxidoreductase [Caulobacteraceae bacterium]